MLIYDKTTLAFTLKTEKMLREILGEIEIKVQRRRFTWKNYLYPLQVVVFEGTEWGHFNAPYYQIGLNKKLIYLAKDSVVRDILRHEFAHYLTYLEFGAVDAHGKEFKSICERFGFPEEVALARMDLSESNLKKEGDLSSERILEKVKKLLQLAQSSNTHEAELATVKANQLLLRHNLENLGDEEESLYMDRILQQSRKDSKMVAIYEIIRHFIVRPVFSFGKNSCSLEVSGSLTNVKLARYVGEFLSHELDFLWECTKKDHELRGLRAKNSFFLGIARGFEEKMQGAKAEFSSADQKSLIVVEKKLTLATDMIYRRLSHSRSDHHLDPRANLLGVEKGKSLTIRQGLEGRGKNLYLSAPKV